MLFAQAAGDGIYLYAYDYRTRRVERTEPGSSAKIIFSGGLSVQEYYGGRNTQSQINKDAEALKAAAQRDGAATIKNSSNQDKEAAK